MLCCVVFLLVVGCRLSVVVVVVVSQRVRAEKRVTVWPEVRAANESFVLRDNCQSVERSEEINSMVLGIIKRWRDNFWIE